MDVKIESLERKFSFDGKQYADPNSNVSPNEAVKMLASLNPELSVYANGHAVFEKREKDSIVFTAKKAFADKG